VREGPTRGATIAAAEPARTCLPAYRVRFADEVVGFPVAVASGRGRGQVRTVVSRVADRVQLDRPLMVTPGPDAVFQFGGFAWEWRSGWFRFAETRSRTGATSRSPTAPPGGTPHSTVNLYYNHEDDPREWTSDSDDDGLRIRAGTPDATVQTRGQGGFALLRKEGHREIYMGGDRFVSIGLAGVSATEAIRIYSVTAQGVDN
jgi:hypothetical protein